MSVDELNIFSKSFPSGKLQDTGLHGEFNQIFKGKNNTKILHNFIGKRSKVEFPWPILRPW